MASRLAALLNDSCTLRNPGKAARFYAEICRCLPFIHQVHKMQEIVTVRQLRAIVKEKFVEFKDATDPRVVDLLVFKGREELETYLMMHKQRHHLITEFVAPWSARMTTFKHKPTGNSAFLDDFLSRAYNEIPVK